MKGGFEKKSEFEIGDMVMVETGDGIIHDWTGHKFLIEDMNGDHWFYTYDQLEEMQ